MSKLTDILDSYYEHEVNQNSNNGNDAWTDARDQWVEEIIDQHIKDEGFELKIAAKSLGSVKSKKKTRASRKNGKLGGRPKKS